MPILKPFGWVQEVYRIGPKFLFAGTAGSCFPKDIRALAMMGQEAGVDLAIPTTVDQINERQKAVMGDKVRARFGTDLSGHTFGVWGLDQATNG